MRANDVSAAELAPSEVEYPELAIAAVKAFARSKPWQGTIDERKAKFQALNEALVAAYELKPISVLFGALEGRTSLKSRYRPGERTIYLAGKLSVVTYFHLFALAMGLPPVERFRWSLCLFANRFSRSFASCRQVGMFMLR